MFIPMGKPHLQKGSNRRLFLTSTSLVSTRAQFIEVGSEVFTLVKMCTYRELILNNCCYALNELFVIKDEQVIEVRLLLGALHVSTTRRR